MAGLTLDAGALIAFERNDRRLVALIARSLEHGDSMAVPAGVVGQVWRDGRRQARLARLLGADELEIETLDDRRARDAGQLCGVRGTTDVIDASVVPVQIHVMSVISGVQWNEAWGARVQQASGVRTFTYRSRAHRSMV